MKIFRASLVCFILVGFQAMALASGVEGEGCAAANARYGAAIREAQYAQKQVALHELSPERSEQIWVAAADKAVGVLDDVIRKGLANGVQPMELEKTVHCVQYPYVVQSSVLPTNAPFVIPSSVGMRGYLVALSLIRGNGESISRLELWTKRRGIWTRTAWVGKDWDNATFFVAPKAAPSQGLKWILLYGGREGEVGLTRFQLIENTGQALIPLWGPVLMRGVEVLSVADGQLVVNQDEGPDFKSRETIYKDITYRITKSGLRQIASKERKIPWPSKQEMERIHKQLEQWNKTHQKQIQRWGKEAPDGRPQGKQ